MTPIPHLPYSPYLAPSDIFLFPQMKEVLKGKSFTDMDKVKQKMAEALKDIKIVRFRNSFEQWKRKSQQVYCIKWRVI